MSDPMQSGDVLQQAREKTVERLCEHFAEDAIGVEDFELRVDIANRTADMQELELLLSDLPGGKLVPRKGPGREGGLQTVFPDREQVTLADPDLVPDSEMVIACLCGAKRVGQWIPARRIMVMTLMGGAKLDFREALLAPGVTEVTVISVMGGTDIIVPPELQVETRGFGLMGGFDGDPHSRGVTTTREPILRIKGVAMMAGVKVETRQHGETRRDARRRRKLERKGKKRLTSGDE